MNAKQINNNDFNKTIINGITIYTLKSDDEDFNDVLKENTYPNINLKIVEKYTLKPRTDTGLSAKTL